LNYFVQTKRLKNEENPVHLIQNLFISIVRIANKIKIPIGCHFSVHKNFTSKQVIIWFIWVTNLWSRQKIVYKTANISIT